MKFVGQLVASCGQQCICANRQQNYAHMTIQMCSVYMHMHIDFCYFDRQAQHAHTEPCQYQLKMRKLRN